jgi:CrcB protein
MTRFLLICLGGALGTGARYAMSGWVMTASGSTFPFGTLAVNAIGSFLISIIMVLGLRTEMLSGTTRIVLASGVLGGFTTYSSFNYETLEYVRQGAWSLGALNVLATWVVCLLAGLLGLWIGSTLVSNAG